MKPSKLWFLATLLAAGLTSVVVDAKAATSGAPRVIAYVAGWSMPAAIPAEKLTHINFAFARIDDSGHVVFQDAAFGPALESLVALKQRNPALRVLISIGGWEADGFSDAALTEASRAKFAESAVALMRRHGADGLDLDWEYPGQGAGGIKYRPEDKQNFTLLLAELRRALEAVSDVDGRKGADRYLLTIASADREYFEHTEMDRLHVHLDWINVMAYDFFNSLTPTTGHHAGLFASEFAAPGDRNADASIRQHLAAGIPPEKLVLGVPFYGRRFEGVDPLHDGVHRPYAHYGGDHSHADLVKSFIGRDGFARRWDEKARAPFLWNGATGTFITYEDPESIRAEDGLCAGEASRRRDVLGAESGS